MYKIKRIFDYLSVFIMMITAKIVSIFVKNKSDYKDLWIIAERGSDARDNSYHLFKYITQSHPEVNIKYIISNDSPDREKVAKLGKLIDYKSFEHYLSFLLARVKISTHIDGYSPDILFSYNFRNLFKDNSVKVFLQHGITKDDVEFFHADKTDINMLVCAAVPEYEYIDKVFGYPKGVLQLTGFCRYDNLKKNETLTKKILFMPTWRSSLRTCTQQSFVKSDYYQKYQSFLNSTKLDEILKKYNCEMIFYPHYEVQRFLDSFSVSSDRVHIADFKNSDVQQLLIDSDILVTDYSSVYFDYAYMRKPVIYYHYDDKAYRSEQYKEGYFDYKRDGFGKVIETESETVEEIDRLLESNCIPDEMYLERMNRFFCFDDRENCKRNYEAICSYLK